MYKSTNERTKINTFLFNGDIRFIRNTDIQTKLKSVVKIMGKENLGLEPKDIGTHSLQASYALLNLTLSSALGLLPSFVGFTYVSLRLKIVNLKR